MPNVENIDGADNFAKLVFCLGQINLIILDQVFNKKQRYLLIFATSGPAGPSLAGFVVPIHHAMCLYFTSLVAN